MAETKNTEPNPGRMGMNREQARRMAEVQNKRSGSPPQGPGGPRTAAAGGGSSGGRGGAGVLRRNANMSPVRFLLDVRSELRKVTWPTPREAVDLTLVVLALSIAVGAFLGGVDFVFQELFRWLLGLSGSGAV